MKYRSLITVLLAFCMLLQVFPTSLLETALAAEGNVEAADTERAFSQVAALAAVSAKAGDIHDEGPWQYVLIRDQNYAVITGHIDQGSDLIDIPARLGGADVVALLGGVFAGHDSLQQVSFPVNLYYAAADALPRGVTVWGYHGNYGQRWAASNRHAFRDMSELYFAQGVIDMTGIEKTNFVRVSASLIRMRSLEAARLQTGTVFFLIDPSNPYQVSYYQVKQIEEADENGFVSIACVTPDISRVIDHMQVTDAPMMADMSTLHLADGVTQNGSDGTLTPRGTGGSTGINLKLDFEHELSGKTTFEGSIELSRKTSVSFEYQNLAINTYTISESTEATVSMTLSSDETKSNDRDFNRQIKTLQKENGKAIDGFVDAVKKRAEQNKAFDYDYVQVYMGSVWIFSWGGIFNIRVDINGVLEFKGSASVTYTYESKTETHYYDGRLTVEEKDKTDKTAKQKTTIKAEANLKAGVKIDLNVSIVSKQLANVGMFFGVKGKASISMQDKVVLAVAELGGSTALSSGAVSVAEVNMLDCISIEVTFLVQAEYSLKLKFLEATASGKGTLTLVELPLAQKHLHVTDLKLVRNGQNLFDFVDKTAGDWWHDADACPLTDQVLLMVPEFDRKSSFGKYSLNGLGQIQKEPVLDLAMKAGKNGDSVYYHVVQWFTDEKCTTPVTSWPYSAANGMKLYGKVLPAHTVKIVDVHGRPVEMVSNNRNIGVYVDAAGNTAYLKRYSDAVVYLCEGDIVHTDDLELVTGNVVSWNWVKSEQDLTILDSEFGSSIDIEYADEERVLMIATDQDDCEVTFLNEDGTELGTVSRHLGETVSNADADVQAIVSQITVDPATYELLWRVEGQRVTLDQPYRIARDSVLKALVHNLKAGDAPTVLGDAKAMQNAKQLDDNDVVYVYNKFSDHVQITGVRRNTVTNLSANYLVVPGQIEGLPVTSMSFDTFPTDIYYIKLPSALKKIGTLAKTRLTCVDMSECSQVDELPNSFAYYQNSNIRLKYGIFHSNIVSAGSYAFARGDFDEAIVNMQIGEGAFSGNGMLTNVTLGYAVRILERDTFKNCTNLAGVAYSSDLNTVRYPFAGCKKLALFVPYDYNNEYGLEKQLAVFPAHMKLIEGIRYYERNDPYLSQEYGVLDSECQIRTVYVDAETIGFSAFLNSKCIQKVTIGPNVRLFGIEKDDQYYSPSPFEYTESIRTLIFEDGPRQLHADEDQVKFNVPALAELVIPARVGFQLVLEDCTSLKKLTINDGVMYGPIVQNGTILEEVLLPDSVQDVGSYNNCTALKSVQLPSRLTQLPVGMFSRCTALETIDLPDSITEIGTGAFGGCSSLQKIILPTELQILSDRAFEGCTSLTDVSFPSRLQQIGYQAFSGCTALVSVNLPDSLTTFGKEAFLNCASLQNVTVPFVGESRKDPSTWYHTLSFGSNTKGLDYQFKGCTLESLTVTDMPSVYDKAFYGKSGVKITILNPISVVGSMAFADGELVGELDLSTVVYIGDEAFARASVDRIVGWSNMPAIGQNAFSAFNVKSGLTGSVDFIQQFSSLGADWKKIQDLVVTDGQAIPAGMFENLRYLYHVTLPEGMTTIGSRAFAGSHIKTITLPDTLQTISADAFDQCSSLNTVYVSLQTLKNMLNNAGVVARAAGTGSAAFNALFEERITVMVTSGTEVPDRAFEGMDVAEILLPQGVTNIGKRAFASMRFAGSIMMPDTVTTIGEGAFAQSYVQKLVLSSNLSSIAADAFDQAHIQEVSSTSYNAQIAEITSRLGIPYQYGTQGDCRVLTLVSSDGYQWEQYFVQAGAYISGILDAVGQEIAQRENEYTVFCGWSYDSNGYRFFTETVMPDDNLLLYAYESHGYEVIIKIMADGVLRETYTQRFGSGMTVNPEVRDLDGMTFAGWYLDEAMTKPMPSDTVIKEPYSKMTLYGRYISGTGASVYEVNGGEATLIKYYPLEGENSIVYLPAWYQGVMVTSIAAGAFEDAGNITELHLPRYLSMIEAGAFDGLRSLTAYHGTTNGFKAIDGVLFSVNGEKLLSYPRCRAGVYRVSDKVTQIADGAFRNARLLKELHLGDHVVSLGDYALDGCTGLRRLSAYGLTHIGVSAILMNNRELSVYGPVRTGVLRDYLLYRAHDSLEGDIIVPEGVFVVPYNRYYVTLNVDGKELSIAGLQAGSRIPDELLYGKMEDGTVVHTWYRDNACTDIWSSSDTMPTEDITLYAQREAEYSVEECTIDGIQGIRITGYHGLGGAVEVPEDLCGKPVISIGPNAFNGTHGEITLLRIGSNVRQIADSALSMENYAFTGVIYVDEGSYAATWAVEHGYRTEFSVYRLSFVTNSNSVLSDYELSAGSQLRLPVLSDPLGIAVFTGWYMDEQLDLPVTLVEGCFVMPAENVVIYGGWDGVPGSYPFTYELAGDHIVITGGEFSAFPRNINGFPVTEIGEEAFMYSDVKELDLSGISVIGKRAFYGSQKLTSISMPDAIRIEKEAFADCTALPSITLPAGVSYVAADAFMGCYCLEAIHVEERNRLFAAVDGVLYRQDALYVYPAGRTNEVFQIPEGTREITEGAFNQNEYVQSILIPASVESIGRGAMQYCDNLSSVTFAEGCKIWQIPDSCFRGDRMLASFAIPEGVTEIGRCAFSGTGLKEIVIPESVERIGNLAFDLIDNLTMICDYGSAGWYYADKNMIHCREAGTPEIIGLKIDLNRKLWSLGEVMQLEAVIMPAEAGMHQEIMWVTDNSNVLRINGNTAVAVGVGNATLTAMASNGVCDHVSIQVMCGPKVNVPSTIRKGTTFPLHVTNAAEVQGVSYRSSNSEVLAVDDSGMLTALNEGKATLTINCGNGVQADYVIEVIDLHLSACKVIIRQHECIQLQLLLGSDKVVSDAEWGTREDEERLYVESDGFIYGAACGTYQIFCTFEESVFTVDMTVVAETDMTEIRMPKSVKIIEQQAFMQNSSAQIVSVEGGVIGNCAFAGMTSLKQARLGLGVTSIAPDAFTGDDNVVLFCVKNSYAVEYARKNGLPYAIVR